MKNWDIRAFRMLVNIPFLERQVLLAIQWVKTAMRGHLHPIKQVQPLRSHVRSYSPYRSHLAPHLSFSNIIAEHPVQSSLSFSPCLVDDLTQSTAYTEYRIHPVQHTPSTAYTQYSIHPVQHTPSTACTVCSIHRVQHTLSTVSTPHCLSSLHFPNYEFTLECSFSF
jgi:hypothetical protein